MSHCLLHSSSLNDFKIRLQLRISCTQSYHAPTFNTSFPLLSHPFTLSACDGRENLPTPEMRQGNLEPATFSLSLDSTRNTKMLYCANPTSTLLGAKQARTKWCHISQPWSNNNILFSDESIVPATNKIKVYASIDSEHKLHQKGLHIWFAVGIKLETPVYFCPVCTGNCCTLNFYKNIGILLE